MSQNFERHVYAVQRYAALTNSRYVPIMDPQRIGHPICCFGDVEKATAITVGVNPSKDEFAPARGWPETISHKDLASRCCEYFTNGNRHKWFSPWVDALKCLKLSYTAASAAHLDLSPRATKYMSELKEAWEQELFLEMVEHDLWTLLGTLELCREAKLILMAGSVTSKYYINEFL